MIRRSDITTTDGTTAEGGVYITVKDALGNIVALFKDDGTNLGNPFQSNITAPVGAFYYNVQNAGTYTEEYRLSLADAPRKVQSVVLVSATTTFTPEGSGAVGDGVNDDYGAWKLLAAAINAAGHGIISLTPGATYHWDHFVQTGNGISATDTQFANLTSLVIYGNNAKIDIKGNFDRNASTTYGLTGLLLNKCNNVRVFDLEVDGNVDQMTNSSGSTETLYPTGIILKGCNDAFFSNVNAHHFSTDGWRVAASDSDGTKTYASRRVLILNCRGQHNARQGITVEGGRGVTIQGGLYSDSGYTGGSYAGHAPFTAIDIEPNFGPSDVSPNTRDINTGDVIVDGVRFENNKGGSFRSAGNIGTTTTERIDTVTVRNSTFIADTTSTTEELLVGSRGFRVDGNNFTLTNNYVRLGYNGLGGSDLTVDGFFCENIVRGHGAELVLSLHEVGRLVEENNEIICDATGAWSGLLWSSTISNVLRQNNRYYIPQAAYSGAGAGQTVTSPGSGTPVHRNNRYETDLPVSGSQHFAVSYSANAVVENDKLVGTAAGTADTFRPLLNSPFDTGGRYNKNHKEANPRGSVRPGNGNYTFNPTQSPRVIDYDTAITADRAITLSTTNAFEDCECLVLRRAACTGAFNLNIGTGPLKALGTAATWALFRYINGAFAEISSGSL